MPTTNAIGSKMTKEELAALAAQLKPVLNPSVRQAMLDDPRTAIAKSLLEKASDSTPAAAGKYAWMTGLSRLGSGVAGGLLEKENRELYSKASKVQSEADNEYRKRYLKALGIDLGDETIAPTAPAGGAPPPVAYDEVAAAAQQQQPAAAAAPVPPPQAAPPAVAPPSLPADFASNLGPDIARSIGGAPPPNPPVAPALDSRGALGAIPQSAPQPGPPQPPLPPPVPSAAPVAMPPPSPQQAPLPPPQPPISAGAALPPEAAVNGPVASMDPSGLPPSSPAASVSPTPSPSPLSPPPQPLRTAALPDAGTELLGGAEGTDDLSGGAGTDTISRRDLSKVPFAAVKDTIGNMEGPAALGGYDAQAYNTGNGNSAGLDRSFKPTQMTIGEVMDYQKNVMRPKTRLVGTTPGQKRIGSSGIGRYQFEHDTLAQNAEKAFGANYRKVPFTPENQDRVAETLYDAVKNNPALARNTWAALSGRKVSVGAQSDIGEQSTDTMAGGAAQDEIPLPPAPEKPTRPADRERIRSARLQMAAAILGGGGSPLGADFTAASVQPVFDKGLEDEQAAREEQYKVQTQLDRDEFKQAMEDYSNQTRDLSQAQIAERAAAQKFGYDKDLTDIRSKAQIEAAKAKVAATPVKVKNLPAAINKTISAQSSALSRLGEAMAGFKPEYFQNYGSKLVGQGKDAWSNIKGSIGIGTDADANRVVWRKNFNAIQNIDRHELFGSALSAGEAKAWDAASTNEGDSPAVAAKNLRIRYNIIKDNLSKATASAIGGGYDQEQIQGLIGNSLAPVTNPDLDQFTTPAVPRKSRAPGQPRKTVTPVPVQMNGGSYIKGPNGWEKVG